MSGLVEQCTGLQSHLDRTASLADDFQAQHPQAQSVQNEVRGLQVVARNLAGAAADFDAADGVSIPPKLLACLRDVPAYCLASTASVEAVLSRGKAGNSGVAAELAAEVDRVRPTLEIARRALSLAAETLSMAKCLQVARDTGDSPPYVASGITPEIIAVRALVSNLQDATRSGAQTNGSSTKGSVSLEQVSEFLEQLQLFASEHSGSLVPPTTTAGGNLSPAQGRRTPSSDSGSAYAVSIQSVNLPPGPLTLSPKHVGRVPHVRGEPLEVPFVFHHSTHTPSVAVINLFEPVAIHDVIGSKDSTGNSSSNSVRQIPSTAGTMAVFSAASPVLAVVSEPFSMGVSAPRYPVWHDGEHYADPMMIVWDYGMRPPRRNFSLRWMGIRPFAFSPNGSLLAVRGVRHRVELVEAAKGMGRGVLRCHTDEVTAAQFTADGSGLVTMSRDGTLRVSDVATLAGLLRLELHDEWRSPPLLLAVPAAATPTSPTDVVASVWGPGSGTVTLWNLHTGASASYKLASVRAAEGWPLAISPDLRYLACRTDDGIDVSELATGKILCRVRVPNGFVTAASFSPDSRYMAVGRTTTSHYGRLPMSGVIDVWELVA